MPGVLDATAGCRAGPVEVPSAAGSSTDGVGGSRVAGEMRGGGCDGGVGGGRARPVAEQQQQQRQQQQQAPVHGAAREQGAEDRGGHADAASVGAPQPADLPPLRGWRVPTVPRAAIQREADAAAQRLGHLKAHGAKPGRLERAEKRKEDAEQRLKVAGGPTSRSLLWQIKSEEDKIDQAQKAVDREKEEQAEKVEQVAKLQAEIAASEALVQRLCERKAEAAARLQYLTNQKWVENMPPAWVEQFRVLERTLGETGHQAHSMVQVLLGLMVLPAEDMDITLGDSDSGGPGSGTDVEGECSSNGTKPEEEDLEMGSCGAARAGGATSPGFDDGADLQRAEAELEDVRSRRLEAVAKAQAAQRERERTSKRTREGDVIGPEDMDGDCDMVPPLTVDQVENMFRPQIDAKAAEVARLRGADDECVPTLGALSGERGPAVGGRPQRRGRSMEAPRGNAARSPLRRRGARADEADAKAVASALVGLRNSGRIPQHGCGKGGGAPASSERGRPRSRGAGCGPLGTSVAAAARGEEDLQDRMQVLQDKEAARAAAVRQAKEEIEARINARGPAEGQVPAIGGWPAYGPTGQRLDEHQRIFLRTARPRSAGAACSDAEMVGGGAESGGDELSAGRERLPAAFRGSRWKTFRADASIERGRERSPRPGLPAFLRGRAG